MESTIVTSIRQPGLMIKQEKGGKDLAAGAIVNRSGPRCRSRQPPAAVSRSGSNASRSNTPSDLLAPHPRQRPGPLTATTDLAVIEGEGKVGHIWASHDRALARIRENALESLGWTGREAEWLSGLGQSLAQARAALSGRNSVITSRPAVQTRPTGYCADDLIVVRLRRSVEGEWPFKSMAEASTSARISSFKVFDRALRSR